MRKFRFWGIAALAASAAYGQSVISARSGLIHYIEGDVQVGDKTVVMKPAEFPEMKRGDVLRTSEGRAEVLLTPGVFLRVAENSSFRLDSTSLDEPKLELLSGSALLEVGELEKSTAILVTVSGATLEFSKRGLFRIDADPARLRAYDGSAVVVASGETITVKEGREALLAGVVAPEKFNKESGDAFYRWASRRASYIALANVTAAKMAQRSGVGLVGNSWMYNPYFGLFTFMPFTGSYVNPWGYRFYSPAMVDRVYYRPRPMAPVNSGGGFGGSPAWTQRGYGDMGGRSMGSYGGGGGISAAPAAAAPAPSSGGGRGASSGGSRQSSGGR